MRLLSWNVRDLLGDPLAVHRVIRSAGADVVCLQEAPRRPGAWLRLRLLESGTGLRCIAGGRRSGGTAIFVAPHVRRDWSSAFRLPVAGALARTRGASVADLHLGGVGAVTVASVHLPLRAEERVDHVNLVSRVIRWRGRPAVVAGDLNEPPGGPAWAAWDSLVADPRPDAGPTYPAGCPTVRIDAVLVDHRLRARPPVESGWRLDDVRKASDHLPVLAVISPP